MPSAAEEAVDLGGVVVDEKPPVARQNDRDRVVAGDVVDAEVAGAERAAAPERERSPAPACETEPASARSARRRPSKRSAPGRPGRENWIRSPRMRAVTAVGAG